MLSSSRKSLRSKGSIERRRANGEISCAECRRQKLKCDKAIPCGTCRRKGCESICPNGTLAPVHVPRLASGDNDLQTHKLMQMSKRVRQLEDALQIAHSSVPGGGTTHPLLSDELLKVKNVANALPPVKSESDASDEETIDMVGTLVNMGRGTESYLSASELGIGHFAPVNFSYGRPAVPLACPHANQPPAIFPFKPLYLPAEEIQDQIERRLPSYERGSALVEAYLENTSWLAKMVDREQITDELMRQVYRRRSILHSSSAEEPRRTHPHTLSLLLALFAVGAVADMTLSPWNEEADLYYYLSWTAIGLESIFDTTNLHTIQALAVLGIYDVFSCRKRSLESCWKIVNFCVSLAASIGLHRDPTHFKLPPKQVQRRRRLLWELLSIDTWKSVGTGRPLQLYPSIIDCELPEDTDATVTKDGVKLPSIWYIRYIYSKEVMASIVDKFTSVKRLKYSDVLTVDRKIREFDMANSSPVKSDIGQDSGPGAHMVLLLKDSALILLHRNFFVRAIIENPEDPARSRFGPSFLSAYRSAVTFLHTVRGLLKDQPHIISRVWPFWAHTISASVLLGSVSACATTSSLAPQAYEELNNAILMFEKSHTHPLVMDVLPTVLMLRDRAYEALTRRGINVPAPHPYPAGTASGLGTSPTNADVARGPGTGHEYAQGMSSMLPSVSESRPMASSSSNTTSSGLQESVRPEAIFSSQAPWTLTNSTTSSLPGPSHGGLTGTGLPHDRSACIPTSCGGVPNYHELLQMHPGSNDASQSMTSAAQQSAPPQTDIGTTHMDNQRPGGPNSGGTGSTSGSEGLSTLHGLSNASLGVYAPGQVTNSQQTQMQVDPQSYLFGYDVPPNLQPGPLFNADFDISYDMRETAGNDFLSSISDDLAACRTILTDSRFFGHQSSTETPPPPSQF